MNSSSRQILSDGDFTERLLYITQKCLEYERGPTIFCFRAATRQMGELPNDGMKIILVSFLSSIFRPFD